MRGASYSFAKNILLLATFFSHVGYAAPGPCGSIGGIPRQCDPEVNSQVLSVTGPTWPRQFIQGKVFVGDTYVGLPMTPADPGIMFGPYWDMEFPGKLVTEVKFEVNLENSYANNDSNTLSCSWESSHRNFNDPSATLVETSYTGALYATPAQFKLNPIIAEFQVTSNAGTVILDSVPVRYSDFQFMNRRQSEWEGNTRYDSSTYKATVAVNRVIIIPGATTGVEFRFVPRTLSFILQGMDWTINDETGNNYYGTCSSFRFNAKLTSLTASYYY